SSFEGRVISEGISPTFATEFAAVFAIYYIFNLQYQEEAACTLEFIQRRFIGMNPERGTKAKRDKVVSKKKGVIVQKKTSAVHTHVAMLLKNLLDIEWNFIGNSRIMLPRGTAATKMIVISPGSTRTKT
ncbi:hypothetical protein FQN60_005308, partial [Etheostoma spectabile]